MLILPAIDLKDGKCVRLRQGRADDSVVYAEDPVAMARQWADQGARYLHVVDLDGAFRGEPVHRDVIAAIARAVPIPIEVGGGLRHEPDADFLFEHGVQRVILGTRAVGDPALVQAFGKRYGSKFAVGIDARDGRVQIRGWEVPVDLTATDFARRLVADGVQTIIYTDISRDGMLRGVNAPAVDAMCAAVPNCAIIASGGVTSVEDIAALRALNRSNLSGAIVGKALYEGRTTLAELIRAARAEGE